LDVEVGGNIFLESVEEHLPDCTVSSTMKLALFLLVTIVRSSNPIAMLGFL
jgi:hypothetical protein